MSTTLPPIWYSGKRVARTVFQFLVVAVPVANVVAANVIDYLRTQQDLTVPAWVYAVLNAILIATGLVIGLTARIMAIPQVNDILGRVGLGSVPASRVTGGEVLPDPTMTRAEYRAALDPHNPAAFRDPGGHNAP